MLAVEHRAGGILGALVRLVVSRRDRWGSCGEVHSTGPRGALRCIEAPGHPGEHVTYMVVRW